VSSSFVGNILPWLVGAVVVAVVLVVLWRNFRQQDTAPQRDDYLYALELWIEGELEDAAALLHTVVHKDPQAVEPFIHLGNLLRLQGDPERAAVLHRGLTVRPDLTLAQKIVVGLSLAEDLNALVRWDESGQVLDTLLRNATNRSRYWRARFYQRHGQGNLAEAARTLKNAVKYAPRRDNEWFTNAYASYQLDRALKSALDGEKGDARARLKDVKNLPVAESRAALVTAILAAIENDAATAVTVASEQLLHSPEELGIFLPLLQEVLLGTGQYARTIPILERACQAEGAPASLWIDLAMLYEKLDDREKALRLLQTKAGRAHFSPDAAAPYLKMLMADVPDSDVATTWGMLSMPQAPDGWNCTSCAHRADHVRWYCPQCGSFDTFVAAPDAGEVS
jgi:lipopolysaccharide biosynthesis regulator YciM